MDLDALADFNLVATHGGFGRASRASDRAKATLSRHVTDLERQLGTRLVERGSHMLRLTDEGRALHERTMGPIAELQEAGDAIASGTGTPRGRLRISAPIVFAHVALCRVAARFALAYPEVRLEIVADDRPVDPVDEGFDLVIRVDPDADDRLVGRRIMGDERLIVSMAPAPRFRSRQGAPTVPAVLFARTPADTLWRYRTPRGDVRTAKPEPVLRMSSLLMVRDAVLAGAGAAMLPRLLVADDIALGRLVCWGIDDAPPVAIWALQSSHRLISAKVRAFLDALAEAYPNKRFASESAPAVGRRTRR